MPRPPRASWETEPAFQRTVEMQAMMERGAPEMSAIHEMVADEPDECWNLLRQSFATVTFECIAAVSGYARWWSECSMGPAYQRWADLLRLIGMNDRERRFILKDPSHLFALPDLLAAVPDALIVMTHRDPARSIPSVCSLNASARRVNDRAYDPERLGAEQLALWGRGVGRAMDLRAREPERFVDIHFDELRSEPRRVIQRIYERAGIAGDAAAERAMLAFNGARPAHPHSYAPEQFGLSSEAIRRTFASYIDKTQVRLE